MLSIRWIIVNTFAAVRRQAYIKGSSLAVWKVVMVVQDYGLDVAKTAEHLQWPAFKVQAALNYRRAFPEDIDYAIADHDSFDFDKIARLLPQLEHFAVPSDYDDAAKPAPTGDGDAT